MYHLCNNCRRPATQAEHNLCDRCWAQKYSKQWYNGEEIPYAELFKKTIGVMGKQADESREEWFARCQDHVTQDGYGNSVIKSKGAKATAEGSSLDTGSQPNSGG